MELRGYLLVLLAAAMWGLIGPVAKFVFAAGVTPLETAFWRAVLSWFLFAAHALALGEVRIQRRDAPAILLFGVVCVALFYGSYQLAVEDVGAALASVLLYTAPAWVALLSWLVLREPMGPMKLLAVGMTVAGVWLVSLNGGLAGADLTLLGIVWGLTAGLTYALYYIFGKLYLGRYATPTVFLYALPLGALALLPFVNFRPKPLQAWLGMGVLALCATYGAYSIYYAGLKRLEATRAAVVATLEPVTAAVLAYLWWDETFGVGGYVGSVLIIGAVLVIVLARGPRPAGRTTETPE